MQQQVCVVLGLPQHKVTVRCKRTGGGFGGKERLLLSTGIDTDIVGSSRCFPALMASIAAVSLKRPVRFVLTREVDTATTGHRCFFGVDDVTLFEPGTRQALPTSSASTARDAFSLLDLIWQSMPAAPATSQSPGLMSSSSDKTLV